MAGKLSARTLALLAVVNAAALGDTDNLQEMAAAALALAPDAPPVLGHPLCPTNDCGWGRHIPCGTVACPFTAGRPDMHGFLQDQGRVPGGAAHSPTPWSIDDFAIRDAHGHKLLSAAYAKSAGCSMSVTEAEKAANLRLWLASPELLDWLRHALDYFDAVVEGEDLEDGAIRDVNDLAFEAHQLLQRIEPPPVLGMAVSR